MATNQLATALWLFSVPTGPVNKRRKRSPAGWEKQIIQTKQSTLWLFNIAMENGPFIDDFPIKTSIYEGFSIAMLNNKRVIFWKWSCGRWKSKPPASQTWHLRAHLDRDPRHALNGCSNRWARIHRTLWCTQSTFYLCYALSADSLVQWSNFIEIDRDVHERSWMAKWMLDLWTILVLNFQGLKKRANMGSRLEQPIYGNASQ